MTCSQIPKHIGRGFGWLRHNVSPAGIAVEYIANRLLGTTAIQHHGEFRELPTTPRASTFDNAVQDSWDVNTATYITNNMLSSLLSEDFRLPAPD
jgi:hypothetical protein